MTGTLTEPTVIRAGVVDYETAWAEQRRLHEAIVNGDAPDTVLLLEHPSVYTAGKRTARGTGRPTAPPSSMSTAVDGSPGTAQASSSATRS